MTLTLKTTGFAILVAMFSVTATADEYLMPKNLNYKNLYFDNEPNVQSEPVEQPARVAPKPVESKPRRLASLDDYSKRSGTISGESRLPAVPKDSWVRLNVMGGISNITGGDAVEQGIRDANNVQQNKYLGVNIDLTIKNYFGLEAEGFYGLANAGTETDGVNSAPTSLQQMGGTGLLKLQAPFRTGRFQITPKAVGGYGLMALKHSGLYGPTEGNSGLVMRGIVVGGGIELEAFNTIIISADYTRSLSATGTYTATTSPDPTDLTNANFDRLRIGAYYRITQGFMLGAQYQQRRVSSDFAGVGFGSPGSQEKLSQITGSIGIEF